MSMAQVSKAASSETASVAAAHFYARYSRSAQCSKLMVKLLRYYILLGNPPLLFVFKFEFQIFIAESALGAFRMV